MDLGGGAVDVQDDVVPVRGGGEPGEQVLGRVLEAGGRGEGAGPGGGLGDAVEAERALFADGGVGAGDVPLAVVGDEAVGGWRVRSLRWPSAAV
ncbi:hypothetical protein GCM10020001_101800 [Nonomuraea salmonea]